MNFRKVNNITGWVVFAIASLVYILTAEKSGSFWDCGEFVASAYKVQLPHPPGAPLFVLIGRFFIVLFGDNPATAAKAVNIMNAVASGFTILFLFWTVTHFARKLTVGSTLEEPNEQQTWTIMAAGIVGGLAYTFSDSFWFSAVEGEVYALSSFFTALVFWAMLKWERADDLAGTDPVLKNRADRWIVFIFFMMGLSIGVHLLNLLTIPAIVMIYYYKRNKYSTKGAIWAFVIGCLITGVTQVAVIQWTIKIAGRFDIFFVNSFDLPFFSGFVFFFILLGVLVWWGLRVANRNGWAFLRLGLWCFIFMMLGYSAYLTTLQRSSANPAIDMNNVDNPMSLVYYLGREQYGSQPLLFGPHFLADYKVDEASGYIEFDSSEMKYTKGRDSYIPIGREQTPLYERNDYQLFPRVWDRSNDQGHADFYQSWLNLEEMQARELAMVTEVQKTEDGYVVQTQDQAGKAGSYSIPGDFSLKVQKGQVVQPGGPPIAVKSPTYADNIQWFITYQMGFMYWRYFMWNYAGKQNDIQGFGNRRDGNWISGFSFIDNPRLGDQAKMPESLRHNKARNTLFLLPFILGMIGCVYHFLKDRRDWIVTFLLFFFTGIAIVIYLNQPGNQPRERDYAYVGSFYAFAIWIGLAVTAIVGMARQKDNHQTFINTLTFGSAATFLIMLMANTTTTFGGAFFSSLLATVVFGAVTALLYFGVRAVSRSENSRTATLAAFALCLAAPLVMASQEWNDHDRSKKTLAPDIARNYMESCAPNAIIFTFGDNDTYPLWYLQEVEGVRPDLRIINYSLLGIDWYANQLRYKVNQSDPINILWGPEKIEGHKREYIRYQEDPNVSGKSWPLLDVMKFLGDGDNASYFPIKKFTVPVDTAYARKSGLASATDTIYGVMNFEIPENRNDLTRADLVILNIIATNNWRRPIYFTSPFGELGFGPYLRKDGFSYRLVPVKTNNPQQNWVVDQAMREARLGGTSIRDNNTDVMYKNMMEKFRFGNADKKNVYFDEENRRHLLSVRSTFAEAAGNMADQNRKQEALNLLNKEEAGISTDNLPYAMTSRWNSHNQTALILLEAAYKAGNGQLAQKLSTTIRRELESQKKYYDYLRTEQEEHFQSMATEAQINELLMQVMDAVEKKYVQKTTPVEHPEEVKKAADSTRTR